MKKIIIALFVIVLAVVGYFMFSANQQGVYSKYADDQPYKNEEYGFEIKIPPVYMTDIRTQKLDYLKRIGTEEYKRIYVLSDEDLKEIPWEKHNYGGRYQKIAFDFLVSKLLVIPVQEGWDKDCYGADPCHPQEELGRNKKYIFVLELPFFFEEDKCADLKDKSLFCDEVHYFENFPKESFSVIQ